MNISEFIDTHTIWIITHGIVVIIIVTIILYNSYYKVKKLKSELKEIRDNPLILNNTTGMKTKLSRDIARIKRKTETK